MVGGVCKMDTVNNVWILAENPESYAALAAIGRKLAGKVEAIWIGSAESAQAVADKGADVVLACGVAEGELVEDGIATVAAALVERKPDIVLVATSKRMRLAAAQIAAAAKTRVVNDATRIWIEGSTPMAEHMVFGGSAYSTERVDGAPAIVLVSDGLLLSEPVGEQTASAAAIEELAAVSAKSGLKLIERKPRTVESVNLAAARHVVSVGRGLGSQEDLALIDELASALEAEVGCTRPIAEGSNWMSRERYIGVSGAMLKPDLFVAVGLSGQIQHMVGANSAKTIIAINKDKNAPVFKQADYGIVGDLYEVVPKLVEALKA